MKRQKQGGFTMIELLIALFVLSFVLLSITSLVYSVMRSTSQSKETSIATTLMQDKLESLKNAGLSSLTSGNDSIRLGNIDYLRQWAVSHSGNVRTITVTVNWINPGSHNVSVTTLRGD
ncbi:MAG: prepilin-type N-terminal cleavage/methylation domain-containing protein [Deltaproteobacteria bacterium]|nr:prepilin-type N-terminal cleavage/methylation domain-containing protein [Deltaproteobacteria bacterium]